MGDVNETIGVKGPEIRVLVIEDDWDFRAALMTYLSGAGFVVGGAGSCAEAEAWLRTNDCDVAVVDRGLPDGEGHDLTRCLKEPYGRGVIILTARDGIENRLEGYASGADHYVSKTMDMRELVAIIQALAARLPRRKTIEKWTLDTVSWHLMAPNGQTVRLTRSEMALVRRLLTEPGEPVSRESLVRALGQAPERYDQRRMDTLMRRLRGKISRELGADLPIDTVHGFGYAFVAAGTLT